EQPGGALAMALSLEGRVPEVGQPGVALCRRLPHLACTEFLPCLGKTRHWHAGRHHLDAAEALRLVLQRLQALAGNANGLVPAIPTYLNEEQIETVHCVAEQARLPLLATVLSPLAAFLAISTRIASSAPVLFVDVDDHALACGLLHKTKPPEQGALSLSHSLTLPHLGLRHWKERLLNHTAE